MRTKKKYRGGRGNNKINGQPNPVDVHVGMKIRERRTLLGMSQQKLGEAIGLTFQQIQKYERGTNRVGSSRMFELTRVLDVPVSYFYEGAEKAAHKTLPLIAVHEPTIDKNPMVKRETLELVRAYYKITDAKIRKRVFELTKACARADAEATA